MRSSNVGNTEARLVGEESLERLSATRRGLPAEASFGEDTVSVATVAPRLSAAPSEMGSELRTFAPSEWPEELVEGPESEPSGELRVPIPQEPDVSFHADSERTWRRSASNALAHVAASSTFGLGMGLGGAGLGAISGTALGAARGIRIGETIGWHSLIGGATLGLFGAAQVTLKNTGVVDALALKLRPLQDHANILRKSLGEAAAQQEVLFERLKRASYQHPEPSFEHLDQLRRSQGLRESVLDESSPLIERDMPFPRGVESQLDKHKYLLLGKVSHEARSSLFALEKSWATQGPQLPRQIYTRTREISGQWAYHLTNPFGSAENARLVVGSAPAHDAQVAGDQSAVAATTITEPSPGV